MTTKEYNKTIEAMAEHVVDAIVWDVTYRTGYHGAIGDYINDIEYDLKRAINKRLKEVSK